MSDTPYIATTLYKTCNACPAQWEGHLKDGRMFYMRYRHGRFSLDVSEYPTDDVGDALYGTELIHIRHGEEGGGYMTEEEMMLLVADHISFDQIPPPGDQDIIPPTPPTSDKGLLCEFFKWFRDSGEVCIGMTIEGLVDTFLSQKDNYNA